MSKHSRVILYVLMFSHFSSPSPAFCMRHKTGETTGEHRLRGREQELF